MFAIVHRCTQSKWGLHSNACREPAKAGPRRLHAPHQLLCITTTACMGPGRMSAEVTRRRDVRLGSKTTGFAYASAALRPSSKEYHSISSPNPRPPLSIGRGTAGNSARARREAIRFTTATPGVHVTGIRLRKHREAPLALRTAFHFPPRGCRYIWRGLRLCRVCHCKAEKEDRRTTFPLRPHLPLPRFPLPLSIFFLQVVLNRNDKVTTG